MIHWGLAHSRVGGGFAAALASLSLTACEIEAIGESARNNVAARPALSDGLADRPFDLARDCIPAGQVDGQCALPPPAPPGGSTYYRISSLTDPVQQATW